VVELSEVRTKPTPKKEDSYMAHAIENRNGKDCMFYVGSEPWHKLGQKLEDNPSITDAISAAGLDWEVGLKHLVTEDGQPVSHKATVRKDDNKIFGVVGPRYTPLQNRDAFEVFQPLLDEGLCSLHTAGSLHGGQKVWVLAKVNSDNAEIVPGDELAKFVLLSNSHDGTTSIRFGHSFIRVVCANTMAMAHSSSASKLIRIRHTTSSKKNLGVVRDIMNVVEADFEASLEQYKFLASRQFNQADIRKYVKIVLGVDKTPEDDIKTRTKNIIDDLLGRIEGPKQRTIAGSWMAAWMGVNEYYNHAKGRTADNRLDSLWFGSGVGDNQKAFQTAMDFANAV
jgi:phage/plasmid-like protein (TIGR03299 family)